jgi:aspartate carbamoyltransferase catalytic subunit
VGGGAVPARPARTSRRHLLDFTEWSVDELMALLDTAEVMAQVLTRTIKKVPALQGFTVASLFFEDSTRTRLSFERAARAQSADVLTFSAGGSSLKKGESMRDTLRTVDQLQVDLYVVRHSSAGAPHQISRWTDAAVVNAGDGRHAHPTQALLDAYTFRAARREATGASLPGAEAFAGQRLAIVGDIGHSRVARSNIELFTALGAEVVLCGPPTLVPPELRSRHGVSVTSRLDEAVEGAAAVMALRMQKERMVTGLLPSITEYVARYQLTERVMRQAGPGAVVMHPGPMNRDVEIESTLADGPRSVIERQVGNGVPVRMAVLYTLLVGRR